MLLYEQTYGKLNYFLFVLKLIMKLVNLLNFVKNLLAKRNYVIWALFFDYEIPKTKENESLKQLSLAVQSTI